MEVRRSCFFGLVVALASVAAVPEAFAQPASAPAAQAPAKNEKPKSRKDAEADEFFDEGRIPQIRLVLAKDQEQKLRAEPRKYVECTLVENDKTTHEKVRIKLKGAAGSFRGFDDRPALTLNMPKGKGKEFHGLDKFHLNNSVQDESCMSELLCARLCRAAGYPATRVTHARVWLQGRDLGLYVLKEGFDEDFLRRNFPSAEGRGNLYDGGFCQEIDANLERDEGEGPEDRADLKAVVAACREPDPAKKAALVQERVDVDRFLTFTALELMMCHWDGYVQNRNNYRVYFPADTGKAVFLLHGMDQMFGDPNFPVFHVPGPLVANAVLSQPALRARYLERVRELVPLFAPEKLHAIVDEAHARVRPVVAAIGEDRARHFDARVKDFRSRLDARQANILRQRPPEPLRMNKDGWAQIEGWEPRPVGDAKLEKKEVDGRQVLVIETGPSRNCVASFRTKVQLGPGTYRLEAKAKLAGVATLDGDKSPGAGLRISGGECENRTLGTSDWRDLSQTIEVADVVRDLELVAELRSSAGTALFDLKSLRVVKVK